MAISMKIQNAAFTQFNLSRVATFREMLMTNPDWQVAGMMAIYAMQTSDEQSSRTTTHDNNVGFSAFDAEILSSFAEFYKRYNRLSEKQMAIVGKRMPKYSAQLWSLAYAKCLYAT